HTRSYGDWSSDVCSSDLSSPTGPLSMKKPPSLIVSAVTPMSVAPPFPAAGAGEAGAAGPVGDGPPDAADREPAGPPEAAAVAPEIGRASCRERGGGGGVG